VASVTVSLPLTILDKLDDLIDLHGGEHDGIAISGSGFRNRIYPRGTLGRPDCANCDSTQAKTLTPDRSHPFRLLAGTVLS
jgi:hypothetical protein